MKSEIVKVKGKIEAVGEMERGEEEFNAVYLRL